MVDLDKVEEELRVLTREIHKLEVALGLLKVKRDALVIDHADSISRRRMAALTDLTPGRIQQIIDRPRRR